MPRFVVEMMQTVTVHVSVIREESVPHASRGVAVMGGTQDKRQDRARAARRRSTIAPETPLTPSRASRPASRDRSEEAGPEGDLAPPRGRPAARRGPARRDALTRAPLAHTPEPGRSAVTPAGLCHDWAEVPAHADVSCHAPVTVDGQPHEVPRSGSLTGGQTRHSVACPL